MKTAKILSWLVAMAGLWEVLAPFILGYTATTVALWNAIIAGGGLIILAVWAALSESASTYIILDWISSVVGVWLVVSPFALRYWAIAVAPWNDILVGAVVVVLTSWAANVLDKQIPAHGG